MSRKILSLIVAVAFVLTTMSTAFAAAVPSDVTGDYVKSVTKLMGLGIINGYDDGSFKPADPIKRSEFAKMAVVALGLNDAATISKGTTAFTDVAADHWASGYINVASQQGIIKGYAGKFSPEATITYAEAITIITRMLGYAPVLDSLKWPDSYVAKATEIGVVSGVVMAPSIAANRGDVAKMINNSLTINPLKVDNYTANGIPTYKVSVDADGLTILEKRLKFSKVDVDPASATVVDKVTVLSTASVQPTATVEASDFVNGNLSSSYKFADGINGDDYLGLEVKAWYKDYDGTNKVGVVEVQTAAADIYDGVISKDSAKIKLEKLSKSYDTAAAGAKFFVNASPAASLVGFVNALGNDKANARVVLGDGKVKYAYAWVDKGVATMSASFTVKEIKDGLIKQIGTSGATTQRMSQGDIKISDIKDKVAIKTLRLDVIKDGKAVTIDDVKAGDVVTVVLPAGNTVTAYSGYQRWIVTSATATGLMGAPDGVAADLSVKIGDVSYKLAAQHSISLNDGGDYDTDFSKIGKLNGKTVTARLNQAGQIYDLRGVANNTTYYYGIFVSAAQNAGTTGGDSIATLYKDDGTKVTLSFEKSGDLTYVNSSTKVYHVKYATGMVSGTSQDLATSAYAKGQLVQYQLTSDNKIKEFSLKNGVVAGVHNAAFADGVSVANAGSAPANAAAIANNFITTGTTINSVQSSTKIFNTYDLTVNDNDVKMVGYSAIDLKPTSANYTVAYKEGAAKAIRVESTGGSDAIQSATSGVVTGISSKDDDTLVTINAGGTSYTYKYDATNVGANFTASGIAKGKFVDYRVSGDKLVTLNSVSNWVYNQGMTLSNLTYAATTGAYMFRITGIDGSLLKVKIFDSLKQEVGLEMAFILDTDLKVYDVDKDKNVASKTKADLTVGDYVILDKGCTRIVPDVTTNDLVVNTNKVTAIVRTATDNITTP